MLLSSKLVQKVSIRLALRPMCGSEVLFNAGFTVVASVALFQVVQVDLMLEVDVAEFVKDFSHGCTDARRRHAVAVVC
jgi:hypothetical protein